MSQPIVENNSVGVKTNDWPDLRMIDLYFIHLFVTARDNIETTENIFSNLFLKIFTFETKKKTFTFNWPMISFVRSATQKFCSFEQINVVFLVKPCHFSHCLVKHVIINIILSVQKVHLLFQSFLFPCLSKFIKSFNRWFVSSIFHRFKGNCWFLSQTLCHFFERSKTTLLVARRSIVRHQKRLGVRAGKKNLFALPL